jgi:predicted alpha/beta hydrolase family esterase
VVRDVKAKRHLLFVQGGGKGTHDDWDSKLVASLAGHLGEAWEIHYPRMPREDDPHYETWRKVLAKAFRSLPDGVVAVGHSIGGTILVRALADEPPARELGALLLIAPPFVGPGGWSADDLQLPADLGARLPADLAVHVFQGLADDVVPLAHADLYARAVPQARVHRLEDRDHQLNDDLKEVALVIAAHVSRL